MQGHAEAGAIAQRVLGSNLLRSLERCYQTARDVRVLALQTAADADDVNRRKNALLS